MTDTSENVGKSSRAGGTARGEAQRRALVDEAYRLIAEGGFERLRTREVASRAGVNTATLHYYFPTKEDLIRGVVERLFQEVSTRHTPTPEEDTPPLEELREEFADVRYKLRENTETYIVLFELSQRSLRDPIARSMLEELDAQWWRHIEGYLTEGVRQGVFRSDLDVPAATAGLIAFGKGSITQAMINPQAFPAERVFEEIERWITGNPPSNEPD